LILLFSRVLIVIGLLVGFSMFTPDLFADPLETEYMQLLPTSEEEILQTAAAELDLYVFTTHQTLTSSRLAQVTAAFVLPAVYDDVTVVWRTECESLSIASLTTDFIVSGTDGPITIPVYVVSIVQIPTVWQGNQEFSLHATFSFQESSLDKDYLGAVIPTMPADFWGGAVFTAVRYVSMFVEGVLTTVGISLFGTIVGFILALFLVVLRIEKANPRESKAGRFFKKVAAGFAKLYITVFRGTPMIVQACFFWYGLGLFGDAMLCGLFVVSLNTAAYIAEILRGGIESIDVGQTEAGRSLGLSHLQTMAFVVFPQAIKNSMPAIGNEFIINLKDTAILSVIGIFELFNQTQKIAGMHYRQLEAYFVVALIYLFLTVGMTKLLGGIEKKLDMPLKALPSSN
jgi:His/Glu/Gln/Arg/opine family amino acid ABC transporter permease subunit